MNEPIQKRLWNRKMRVVEFHLGDLAESHDPLDIDDSLEPAESAPVNEQIRMQEFTEIEDDGEELPF